LRDSSGDCSIERVASHLAMGKRTLQRQLKQHDTSYKDLLEDGYRQALPARVQRFTNGPCGYAVLLGPEHLFHRFSPAARRVAQGVAQAAHHRRLK